MLENFRRNVGLSYSRLHFRGNRDKMMNFTNALSRARRALVIFPDLSMDGETAATVFRYLSRKFSSDSMTVLVRHDQLSYVTASSPLKTLTYTPEDINTWYVPRRSLVKKMMAMNFDVAFDLNVDLSVTGAFLCKASNAPLRISFAKDRGDQFYNFQVQTRGTSNRPHSYRTLLKYLEMF
jgi:hypothetical protein